MNSRVGGERTKCQPRAAKSTMTESTQHCCCSSPSTSTLEQLLKGGAKVDRRGRWSPSIPTGSGSWRTQICGFKESSLSSFVKKVLQCDYQLLPKKPVFEELFGEESWSAGGWTAGEGTRAAVSARLMERVGACSMRGAWCLQGAADGYPSPRQGVGVLRCRMGRVYGQLREGLGGGSERVSSRLKLK